MMGQTLTIAPVAGRDSRKKPMIRHAKAAREKKSLSCCRKISNALRYITCAGRAGMDYRAG